ncbi:Lrp/AsnC family leucine-responsive transcriptional regulator [Nocardioides thalensis]|uniref:Lrp/AsnC family leucine-responsive transcriptional regulator n=1 Tax=Nocardioides thalensis TaxID=1914755 RepID=A0A853C705_9ACTN|nr:Lrp/AsnC family transcriptional regulator [Nocardioides thalensis]NYJ01983.1 Lrp/AsnC family leucine-responsive transcriptional regulator [Nocardioides thalensis]
MAIVPANPRIDLDETDRELVLLLQRDGRATVADLGRAVSLSPSATSDRLRRLTDAGVISGYSAVIDPEALGYAITAFVRLSYPSGNYKPFTDMVDATPEIVEAHHVTGVDCFIIKVHARSMQDLERIAGRIAAMGTIATSVVYSSPVPGRHLVPA